MDIGNYKYPELVETKITSERQAIVKEMLETINLSRESAGYSKMPVGRFLGQIKTTHGIANTSTLKEIQRRAEGFDSLSTGISYFMKHKL